MTVLDDHRHLARVTTAAIAVLTTGLAILLFAAGRRADVSGLIAGSLVGICDVMLLSRGLTRIARAGLGLGQRALTVGMMSRYASVGVLLGLAMSTKGVSPVAAVAGFLLFPVSLYFVGARGVLHARRQDRVPG